jgi:hypothetical protein
MFIMQYPTVAALIDALSKLPPTDTVWMFDEMKPAIPRNHQETPNHFIEDVMNGIEAE